MAPKKTAKPVVDLAEYDSLQTKQEEGLDVEIKDPAGRPIGFTIKVAGPDSERQRDAQQGFVDQRVASMKTGSFDSDELKALHLHVVTESTIGWSEFVLDGKKFPFSVENAKVLYVRFPWIREQVDLVAGSRARFLTPSDGSLAKPSGAPSEESSSDTPLQDSSSGSGSGS